MTKSVRQAVTVVPNHNNEASLSSAQKAFNALIKRIEKRRAVLQAWEAAIPNIQKQYVDKLLPLARKYAQARGRMAHKLDDVWANKAITKTERRTLSELITELAGDLVESGDDASLAAIYDKHRETLPGRQGSMEFNDLMHQIDEIVSAEFGGELAQDPPDGWQEQIERTLAEQEAQWEAEERAREEGRAKRKKSARQIAAERKREAEQAQLSRSVREVYRKLASALHPDREPDEQERERKTVLMQEANLAYGKNDILRLLELQLELEHIDQNAINEISEERLKHYNAILKEQVGELDQEIFDVEMNFKAAYGMSPFMQITPRKALSDLTDHLSMLDAKISQLEADMKLVDDVKACKRWIKAMRVLQAEADLHGGTLF